ncbi:MAG: helix-turn-helix domain-containing protein [Coriobacteriia bacterium]
MLVNPSAIEGNPRDAVPVVLTAAEVGAMLKVSDKTIYKWKDDNGLTSHKFGGSVRFYLHEVLTWMDRQPTPSQEQGDDRDA